MNYLLGILCFKGIRSPGR